MRYVENMYRSVLKARTSWCLGICCEVLAQLCQRASTSSETKTYSLWSAWQRSCRDRLTLTSSAYFKPVHLTSHNLLKRKNLETNVTVHKLLGKKTEKNIKSHKTNKQMKIGKCKQARGAFAYSSFWNPSKHVHMPILLLWFFFFFFLL